MARKARLVANPQNRHRYPGEIMDLTGCRYGRLTGIRYERSDDYGRAIWLWRCDCGDTAVKRAIDVRSGQTHSCGCLRKKKPAPPARREPLPDLDVEEHW